MLNKYDKNTVKLVFLTISPVFVILLVNCFVKYVLFPICLWKNLFHFDCFGCGMTRAFYYLFHLDFTNAIKYNNKIIIVAPILIYVWLYEIYKTIKHKNKY